MRVSFHLPQPPHPHRSTWGKAGTRQWAQELAETGSSREREGGEGNNPRKLRNPGQPSHLPIKVLEPSSPSPCTCGGDEHKLVARCFVQLPFGMQGSPPIVCTGPTERTSKDRWETKAGTRRRSCGFKGNAKAIQGACRTGPANIQHLQRLGSVPPLGFFCPW